MKKPVCTIVGMASRVGLHIAKRFANEGYTIAMVGRTKFLLDKYQKKLADAGVQDTHVYCTNGDSLSGLEDAFKHIQASLGDPRVLVYNESVIAQGYSTSLTGDGILSDLRTNIAGAIVSANAVIPSMKENRSGTILFTGGEFATDPDPEYSSLSILNAGTRNLCISLAKELESDNIHVATVTIHGLAKVQTQFDPIGVRFEPEVIADKFFELHSQKPGNFSIEKIYK